MCYDSDRGGTVQVNLSGQLHIEQCKLVVIEGPSLGQENKLSKPIIRIGNDERNDLQLEDNTVSRFHCEIRRIGEEYLLVDHSSTNGTYVADLRIREVWLYSGCEVSLGNSCFRFQPSVEAVQVEPIHRDRYCELIGGSRRMQEVYGIIDKLAPSDLSVVIEGETGTGKELVARALHQGSRRAKKPLEIFDCSAFPESLLESELFGHEKGAFSGAIRSHRGVFERAEGGTIFFDELGELPLKLQPKFLRALENGEIRRVGGERSFKIDIRVLAATNKQLFQLVEMGLFRQDLYYRLAKALVILPPLHERLEDLEPLCRHFLGELDAGSRSFSESTLRLMRAYDWPGNVRELRNVVERAAAFGEQQQIISEDLPGHFKAVQTLESSRAPQGLKAAKEHMVTEFERGYLIALLKRHKMNVTKVAQDAGIDRRHVYRLLKKHEINLPNR